MQRKATYPPQSAFIKCDSASTVTTDKQLKLEWNLENSFTVENLREFRSKRHKKQKNQAFTAGFCQWYTNGSHGILWEQCFYPLELKPILFISFINIV